jgi:hypothetical protein
VRRYADRPIHLDTLLPHRRKLLSDRVVAIRKGLDSLAITTAGIYEVSAGFESIRHTPYNMMGDLALSSNSSDVTVNGRKLSNPFIKPERAKRFAFVPHSVLAEMRAVTQSQDQAV